MTSLQQIIAEELAVFEAIHGDILPPVSVLESDYHLWLSCLLPKHFRSAGPEQFAPHHDQFFDWGWSIQKGSLPSSPACLWIVNREGNKSTSAAGLAVALGAMERRKFGLVITRTEDQGDTHIGRVNSMLLASEVGRVYPSMVSPQLRRIEGKDKRASWNRSVLTTATGWTLQSFSIEAAERGVGHEEYRPDFFWITDIDKESDSPMVVDKLLAALSASVFGTGASDAVVIFDQNLIHKGSVLNRILTRDTDVLSDRLEIGPIPAVYNPTYKREGNHWFILSGIPSWEGLPLSACESTLNRVGKEAWDREYQHDISQVAGRPRFIPAAVAKFTPSDPIIGELRIETDALGRETPKFFHPIQNGALAVWKYPQKGRIYAVGADTAEGRDVRANISLSSSDPDYAVAQVRDAHTGEQVARLRGRLTEGAFGELLYAVLRWYNDAYLVPEIKGGFGRAMLNKLLELGYHQTLIFNKHLMSELEGLPPYRGDVSYHDLGWDTNVRSRPLLISKLDEAILNHTIETYDAVTIEEYRHFCYNSDGKPEAEKGWHDDAVMADALCQIAMIFAKKLEPMRRQAVQPILVQRKYGQQPKKDVEEEQWWKKQAGRR